jgi:hypothetical protein
MWSYIAYAIPVTVGLILVLVKTLRSTSAIRRKRRELRRHRRDLDKGLAAYRQASASWRNAHRDGPPPLPPTFAMDDVVHVAGTNVIHWNSTGD